MANKNFFLYPFIKGQIVTLKKAHPCGSKQWLLIRVSGDVTMECLSCGRKMIMMRSALEKACLHIDTPLNDTGDKM